MRTTKRIFFTLTMPCKPCTMTLGYARAYRVLVSRAKAAKTLQATEQTMGNSQQSSFSLGYSASRALYAMLFYLVSWGLEIH